MPTKFKGTGLSSFTPSRAGLARPERAHIDVASAKVSREKGHTSPEGARQRRTAGPKPNEETPVVQQVLHSPAQQLDAQTRVFMGARFDHDFSQVRVHTGALAARSAAELGAVAYTFGKDVVFGAGQYEPRSNRGRGLIAHELAHVVQQTAPGAGRGRGPAATEGSLEREADRAADAVIQGDPAPNVGTAERRSVQRKVEMRDVGRGEQSGFARLPELVRRLNAMSQGLTFSVDGRGLVYELRAGGTLNNFDTQMRAFIDQEAVIPMRLTNRHGLLGTPATGFNAQVDVDAWTSGYVDIDDLLASSDLGLQSVLVHFLRERSATSNYAHRIGTTTFTQPEFQRVHTLGIGAEEQLLRDYFGDPSIRIVNDSPSPTVRRVFRNSRRDLIRRRVTPGRGVERGVDAMSINVLTRDGVTHTAEDYRRMLEEDRVHNQVEREKLGGAVEYRAGGRGGVPSP